VRVSPVMMEVAVAMSVLLMVEPFDIAFLRLRRGGDGGDGVDDADGFGIGG